MSSKRNENWIVVIVLLALALILYFGQVIADRLDRNEKIFTRPATTETPKIVQRPSQPVSDESIIGLRIERRNITDNKIESTIMINKQEVAKLVIDKGLMTVLSGKILDGKYKFVNEWNNTYGFEHFKKNRRHGNVSEYYSSGQLKTEAEYKRGRLIRRKEFYLDGQLRLEEDLSSARFIAATAKRKGIDEVGVGKIYRIDGTLKIDWSLTDSSDNNFVKIYDREGFLVEARYYNSYGDPIDVNKLSATNSISKFQNPIDETILSPAVE